MGKGNADKQKNSKVNKATLGTYDTLDEGEKRGQGGSQISEVIISDLQIDEEEGNTHGK